MFQVRVCRRKKWCFWIIKWSNKIWDKEGRRNRRGLLCRSLCQWACRSLCRCRCLNLCKCPNPCQWIQINSTILFQPKFHNSLNKRIAISWRLTLLHQACTTCKTSNQLNNRISNNLLPISLPFNNNSNLLKAPPLKHKLLLTSPQWWTTSSLTL